MTLSKAMSNNGKILALFAITCTAIVGGVNEFTKERIYKQQQQQLLTTLNGIIAPHRYNNELTLDCVTITDVSFNQGVQQTAYLARMNNVPVAAALTTTTLDGYNGTIDLLVAINFDGNISGVRTLAHQETPGLGDKIDHKKSDWISIFNNKSLTQENNNTWAVIKDGGSFDQFTGATITPRAVVKAVKNTLIYFNQNKAQLFAMPNACHVDKVDKVDIDLEGSDNELQ